MSNRYNGIIAVVKDPAMTEEEMKAMRNVAPFVAYLPECRTYTDLSGRDWVAVQVMSRSLVEIAGLIGMLSARIEVAATLVVAQQSEAVLRASIGTQVDSIKAIANGKKGAGAAQQVVIPIGLWDYEKLTPDGHALQQGYVWDEGDPDATPPVPGSAMLDTDPANQPLMPFNQAMYLNMQADEVTHDPSDGSEISRTRPTVPRQFNSFAGMPPRYIYVIPAT